MSLTEHYRQSWHAHLLKVPSSSPDGTLILVRYVYRLHVIDVSVLWPVAERSVYHSAVNVNVVPCVFGPSTNFKASASWPNSEVAMISCPGLLCYSTHGSRHPTQVSLGSCHLGQTYFLTPKLAGFRMHSTGLMPAKKQPT